MHQNWQRWAKNWSKEAKVGSYGFWHVLTRFDAFWRILTQSDAFWRVLMGPDWSRWVYYILFMYYVYSSKIWFWGAVISVLSPKSLHKGNLWLVSQELLSWPYTCTEVCKQRLIFSRRNHSICWKYFQGYQIWLCHQKYRKMPDFGSIFILLSKIT